MKRARLVVLYGALLVLIGLNFVAFHERERIGDWFALRNYTAPATIDSLASQTAMTDLGRRLFYVNHPSLETKDGFNEHCSNKTEHSVVLGCYHGNRQGIYLYDVTDPRLQGVKQVTAAHEMLHQAYDRIAAAERKRINTLLLDLSASEDLEQRIKEKIALYKNNDTDNLPNELHSIFGTEVTVLPAALEAHYKHYFSDRKKVLAFSEAYQREFAERQAKVKAYDQELRDLDARIESNKKELDNRQRDFSQQRAQVNELLRKGDSAAYQAGAGAYNKQVAQYNALIDSTQQLIARYNKIVEERNALSTEEQELQQALDSRFETTHDQ